MGLATSRTNLLTSTKALNTRWDRIRPKWDDKVARDFHEEFIAPLDTKVRRGLAAIEQMADVLARIRRDCT